MKYYGIDLGTTNCTISCLDTNSVENIDLSLLKDIMGRTNIRSKITLIDNKNIQIASSSNENLKNTFLLVKGKLGSEKSVSVNNNNVSVQFCAALLLNYMKKIGDNIEDVVITIPAFYNQSKRNSTLEAAKQAGFSEVKLIEEPTSAVMYHLFKEYKVNKNLLIKEKKILVFDFGGGTLDLSLVNVEIDKNLKLNPKVIAIDGLENFGGYLMDILLAKLILTIIKSNSSVEDEFLSLAFDILSNHINSYKDMNNSEVFTNIDDINRFINQLIIESERIKIELSKNLETTVNICNYIDNELIKREFFEECILMDEMILEKISQLLQDFKIKNNHFIDDIILVGGTSQIPRIFELISNTFPNSKVIKDNEYINSVGYGAAIISALNNGEIIEPFGSNVCSGVLPRDIFINCNGEEQKLFDKGTVYPLKNSYVHKIRIPFSLSENISIILFEKDVKKKYKISDVRFYHPCFYTGDIIELIINIDENGMLNFKAIHYNTREEIEFTSEKNNSISNTHIENGYKHIKENINYIGVNYDRI